MSPKDIARSSGGFTLVESVVVMVVLAIVLACIATSLSFGTRIMASQRAIANADTLASTVNTSVSDVLRTSSTAPVIGVDGSSVTFRTSSAPRARRAATPSRPRQTARSRLPMRAEIPAPSCRAASTSTATT